MVGVCLVHVWCLFVLCFVFARRLFDDWFVFLFGVCLVFVWCLCGVCLVVGMCLLAVVRCICGVCLIFVLCLFGSFRLFFLFGVFVVACLVFVWCMCGACAVLRRCFLLVSFVVILLGCGARLLFRQRWVCV